jgi:hypothetical protein
MSETREIAAMLCADKVGYSRLAGAEEDRIKRSHFTVTTIFIDGWMLQRTMKRPAASNL